MWNDGQALYNVIAVIMTIMIIIDIHLNILQSRGRKGPTRSTIGSAMVCWGQVRDRRRVVQPGRRRGGDGREQKAGRAAGAGMKVDGQGRGQDETPGLGQRRCWSVTETGL